MSNVYSTTKNRYWHGKLDMQKCWGKDHHQLFPFGLGFWCQVQDLVAIRGPVFGAMSLKQKR
eukprot:4307883-Amphidinium_carterae.1